MKTKSKSLISIILSIMMVLSMVIVAVPVNAATVENNSVGETTYYLWYANSDDPSGYNNKVQMTQSGSSYVATVNTNGSNFFFLINNSSDNSTSSLVWNDNNKPTVTKDSTFDNWTGQSNHGEYIIVKGRTSKSSMTVTFNPTTNTVDLATGSVVTTKTWHIIGGKEDMFGSWNETDTTTPIDTPYNGSSTIFYAEITFPKNYKSYFRLNDGSSQYSLSNSKELGIGDSNNKQTLVVESSKAMWFDNTSSSSDTKVNFFIDTASNKVWYELVGTEPTTYTVETASTSNGTFSVDKTSAAAGATVTVTTNPATGYKVQSVKYNSSTATTVTANSKYQFTMPASNVTVTVTFEKISYTVTKTTPSNGTFDVSATSATMGEEVTISNISPAEGYEVDTVTVTDASGNEVGTTASGSNYTFTMPASNVSVTVTFKAIETPATDWYISGTLEYVDGHNPKYFNIDTVASSYKMTAEGTNTYTYTYTYPSDVKKFYVVVNDGTNAYHPFDADKGSGAPYNPDVTNKVFAGSPSWYPEFTAGDTVKFTWNVSTGTLSWVKISDTTYTVSADSNLQTGASITFSATAGGESTNTFKENDTVFVTVTNPEGYDCTGVSTSPSVNVNKNSDGTYSFKMPADNVTVSATFTKQLESGAYTITKSTSPFGTMTLKNSSELKEGTANAGDTITVTVNAIKGYACKTLTASTQSGDVTVTANDDGTYTFTMPEANVTLTATFEVTEITYTLKGTVANATVTFSTASSSNAKTAKPGEKVTVTITPKSGYICDYYAVLDMYDNALECERLSSVKCTFIMPECDVTVTAAMKEYIPEANHTFRVYFKSPSAFAYQPKVSVNGGSLVSMTKGQELGKIYSGALTIYWYYIDLTVDTSTATTLTFKTNRTSLNASITDYFTSTEYYLAVDDMMSGKEVVDLTSMPEYVRNYYRSATHMVYPYSGASDDTDNTLGFTNINGVRYKMGEYIKDHKVSIMSATLMQKVSVQAETVDDVQMALLDVNLDGRVDVRDATLTQKYLVSE